MDGQDISAGRPLEDALAAETPSIRASGRSPLAERILGAIRSAISTVGAKYIWVVGATFVVSLLSMVGGILVARTLGPSGRGAVSGAVLVSQVAVWTLTLGMARGNTFYLNHQVVGADRKSVLLVNSLLYSLVTGLVAGALIAHLYFASLLGHVAIYVITALVTAMLAGDFINNLLLASHDYRAYGTKRFVETLAYVTLLLLLAAFGRLTPTGSLAALLASCVGANIVGGVFLSGRGFKFSYRPDRHAFSMVASYGLRSQISDAPRFLSQFLPQLVILPLLGIGAYGLYSVALSLAGLTQMLSGPISSVFLSEWAGKPIDEVKRRAAAGAWRLLCILAVITAVQLIAADPLIRALYGRSFATSVPIARVLSVWFMIGGLNQFLQHTNLAAGTPLRAAFASIVGLVVGLAGIAALARTYGALGIAYACVAASAVECALLASGLGLLPTKQRPV